MFAILGRFFITSAGNRSSISSIVRPLCSNSIKPSSAPDKVLLIGTVYSNPVPLPGERKLFLLRTQETKQNYTVHSVNVTEQKLKLLGTPIATGLKLLIAGRLRVPKFRQLNGKERCTFHINTQSIYSCKKYDSENILLEEQDDDSSVVTSMDRNHIELTAQIAFDIQQIDNYSSFTLAYRYPRTDGSMADAFVSVFAHDDYLNEYVRHNLKKTDRVTVRGQLKYKPTMDDTGKKRHSGYILAYVISKNISLLPKMSHAIA